MRLLLLLAPVLDRIAAVEPPGNGAELFLGGVQFALGNREQTLDRKRDALVEAQLLFETLRAEPEGGLRLRADLGLEVVDVLADGLHRLLRRVGQVRQQVQIVEAAKGLRQIRIDEGHDAAQGVESDLDEHGRRFLDVVAGRLDQSRGLAQFGEDAARAVFFRRVVENRLRSQARGERLGVELGIALPGSNGFELELTGADVGGDDSVFDLLGLRQLRRPEWHRAAWRIRRARSHERQWPHA